MERRSACLVECTVNEVASGEMPDDLAEHQTSPRDTLHGRVGEGPRRWTQTLQARTAMLEIRRGSAVERLD